MLGIGLVTLVILLLLMYQMYAIMYSKPTIRFTNPFNQMHYNSDYDRTTVYHTLDS